MSLTAKGKQVQNQQQNFNQINNLNQISSSQSIKINQANNIGQYNTQYLNNSNPGTPVSFTLPLNINSSINQGQDLLVAVSSPASLSE